MNAEALIYPVGGRPTRSDLRAVTAPRISLFASDFLI